MFPTLCIFTSLKQNPVGHWSTPKTLYCVNLAISQIDLNYQICMFFFNQKWFRSTSFGQLFHPAISSRKHITSAAIRYWVHQIEFGIRLAFLRWCLLSTYKQFTYCGRANGKMYVWNIASVHHIFIYVVWFRVKCLILRFKRKVLF